MLVTFGIGFARLLCNAKTLYSVFFRTAEVTLAASQAFEPCVPIPTDNPAVQI